MQASRFVETLEHRRFTEFCDACQRYGYIGLCYGAPGVGKTLSARRYSRLDALEGVKLRDVPEARLRELTGLSAVLYTTPVVNAPGQTHQEIGRLRSGLHELAQEPLRREEARRLERIRRRDAKHDADLFLKHDWLSSKPFPRPRPSFGEVCLAYATKMKAVGDPTRLILVDEADRLKMASLEQVRAIFDAGGVGLVLIGMPGLEKRLARYAQFYSRVGFVHEFRALRDPEVRQLLSQGWVPTGVTLPELDAEAAAAVIRVTGGNFRLLNRLLTQMERILRINQLAQVTKEVVEAARESLVIGPA
jgi:hypothetical protein